MWSCQDSSAGKVLAVKPEDLSSTLRIYIKMEGRKNYTKLSSYLIFTVVSMCARIRFIHTRIINKSSHHLYPVNFLCAAGTKLCTTRICMNSLKLCSQLFTLGSPHFQRKKLTFRKVKVTVGLEGGGAGVAGGEKEHCGRCAKQIKKIKQKN